MRFRIQLYSFLLVSLFCFAVCQLAAQSEKKNKKSDKCTESVAVTSESPALSDSLVSVIQYQQHVIDSLTSLVKENISGLELMKEKESTLLYENDSLHKVINDQYIYVLNYGNALLYRKYNARVEDILGLLMMMPDTLRRVDRAQMLAEARAMIAASDVPSQDIRNRVFALLQSLPPESLDKQTNKDIQDVLSNVRDYPLEYNMVQHALSLIDALPKDITDNDTRYDLVRTLLSVYKESNDEIKTTLMRIQNSEKNSGVFIEESWPSFVKQLKNTDYYKKYYSQPWTIRYLNNIIDRALQRMQNAKNRVDLDDLINEL